ncbi:TRAPP subunit, partial [Spiromyces aspiralis]
WTVYAYVTPGNARFLLLRDNSSESGVKEFFAGCHEYYLKTLLNPFYQQDTVITSPTFDAKVRQAARRHL